MNIALQVGSSKNFGGRRGAARGPLDTRTALEGWVQEHVESAVLPQFIPGPLGAGCSGSWLRYALQVSRCAAQGAMRGCVAAVRLG